MLKPFRHAQDWLKRRLSATKKSQHDHGAIALTSALLLAVFAGSIGLGVDVANWYDSRLRLQTAADAAVRSAMLSKLQGVATNGALVVSARAQAERNGYDSTKGTVTIFDPPRPAEFSGSNGVEVVLTQSIERQFTRIIRQDDILLEAVAIALPISNDPPCVTALNTTEAQTIHVFGSASLDAQGCELSANSSNPNAISVQGSASVTSECVSSVGPIPSTAGMTLDCASPHEYSSPVTDPFQGTPMPAVAGPCQLDNTLQGKKGIADIGVPGRYCGGLSIKGLAVLLPGPYIIDGGTLSISSSAVVTGAELMFFLTNGAKVQISGGADMALSAPTSGPYTGMLFYGDPANGALSHTINGSPTAVLDGAIYFPNQDVDFRGGADVGGTCTVIVADTISVSGNANLSADCGYLSLPGSGGGTSVRLVR